MENDQAVLLSMVRRVNHRSNGVPFSVCVEHESDGQGSSVVIDADGGTYKMVFRFDHNGWCIDMGVSP